MLPNTRALVGGLLLALAAVGTFSAWRAASGTPDSRYLVVRRDLHAGEVVGEDDVREVAIDLPDEQAAGAFEDWQSVVGQVAVGPIREGELLQSGQLTDAASASTAAEVAFALPRDRALDGALRSGDRVDVFVTYDDRTGVVVEAAQVLVVSTGSSSALADGQQVTITLGLEDGKRRAELVHAVRAAEVTLVRSNPGGIRNGDEGGDGSGGDVYSPAGGAPG